MRIIGFRSKRPPPNYNLSRSAFGNHGSWELWQGMLDIRDRVGKIEGALLLLVPLVLATLGITVSISLR